MKSAGDSQLGRYRRRILGWGSLVVLAIYGAGAAIALPQVEDDLESRVVEMFNDAGVGPVTVSFSGQDGTLTCRSGAVEIPAVLLADVRALRGVVDVDVDASCGAEPPSATTTAAPPATDPPEVTEPAATGPPPTEPPATTTTSPPDDDVLATVIANDSQFTTLDGLLADAGLDQTLVDVASVTFFAPTNEAFQALGPDVVAALGRDPDVLRTVLRHHAAPSTLTASDLTSGELEMLDGTNVVVEVDGEVDGGVVLTSGTSTASIVEADLLASNGVVHAIDAVLLPPDVEVGVPASEPLVTARFADGVLTLSGAVAADEQRDRLVTAATGSLSAENVRDEVTLDADVAVDDADVDRLAQLIESLATELVTAEATLTGTGLTVSGTYRDTAGRDSILAVVEALDVDDDSMVAVELAARPAATDETADALEADLNALVGATPILFEPASAEISDASAAVLDRVAAIVDRLDGVAVEIQGYTDTDGTPANNQLLSEARAEAVLAALVERGVDASALDAVGFGGTDPILDEDGTEDKAASRRVEFIATVQ